METNANQMMSCVVKFAYKAAEADELTIRPGDVITNVERLSDFEGWWRGELRGRRGLFPDNYVYEVTDSNSSNARPRGGLGYCRAVFSYQPTNPDELPLLVGNVLEVIEEVEEGWWRGRHAGRVGVFPSNFVVMMDPQPAQAQTPADPAPALPPKPVKEQCRVLFPYSAVNDDELTLAEGDVVTIVSKDAPDRGWWRGELRGRVGLFPDNFVQLLPPVAQEEEKKPAKAPAKMASVYPALNDFTSTYSEKTNAVKELTTAKISMHKENTVSKESSTQSTVTHTNKSESEKVAHTETVVDGTPDGQLKKPPVPLKKSPTPASTVGGLFSGLKSKMLSSSDKTEKTTVVTVTTSATTAAPAPAPAAAADADRPDGGAASRSSHTFDHVERNTILSDPRAGRVKAPRRRPPSQVLRDDTPQQIGLSNGHEVPTDKGDKGEKPDKRSWEKQQLPWMEELKLNQAKKTAEPRARPAHTGSTDRILECGLEEKKSSHMEMSKSTSSISNRISIIENIEMSLETKSRQSSEPKRDSLPPELPATKPPAVQSPTAAGRTIMTTLDEIKKPPAPAPPAKEPTPEKSPVTKVEKVLTEKVSEVNSISKFSNVLEKTNTLERLDREKERVAEKTSTLERRALNRVEKTESAEATIAQLNTRLLNLEKLIELQNTKFAVAIEELNMRLKLETSKRMELQSQMEKLAQCVTQV